MLKLLAHIRLAIKWWVTSYFANRCVRLPNAQQKNCVKKKQYCRLVILCVQSNHFSHHESHYYQQEAQTLIYPTQDTRNIIQAQSFCLTDFGFRMWNTVKLVNWCRRFTRLIEEKMLSGLQSRVFKCNQFMENEAAISFASMDNSIFWHSCRKMLIMVWLLFEHLW